MDDPVAIWAANFRPVGTCVLNPNGDVLQGCVSSRDRSRVEIIDLGGESILDRRGLDWNVDISSMQDGEVDNGQRNESDTVRVAIVREISLLDALRSGPPNQADVVIFPGQSKLPLDFGTMIWGSIPFRENWDYRTSHDDGVDTISTTVVLFRKHELWEVEVTGPFHSQTGKKSSGIVAKIFLVDKRMTLDTGRRLGIDVVSSVVYPTALVTGGEHDQDHGAFGLNILGPQGRDLFRSIRLIVAKDLGDSLSKCTRNRIPVLAVASNDYFEGTTLTRDFEALGLRSFRYCGNTISFSPVIPSLTNEVVVNRRSELILTISKRALLNADGFCCRMTPERSRVHGYGNHEDHEVAPISYPNHVSPQYMLNLRGYARGLRNNYEPLSAEGTEGVNIISAIGEHNVAIAINALENVEVRVRAIDCEWHPELRVLGTVSIAFNERGTTVLLYFPLQHIRELGVGGLYEQVLATLKRFFTRENTVLVGYDLKNDISVLQGAGISPNKNLLFDIKKEMGGVFPIAYSKYEGSPKRMETDLGLRHFVQMALSLNLIKHQQNPDWTNPEIQELPASVNYAVTDAYAVLLVYNHYNDLLTTLRG